MTSSTPQAAEKRLLDLEGIALKCNCSERMARRIVSERRVPVVKIGKLCRVWSDDLEAYLEQNTRPAVGGTK
jgi:hypothetical protein